MTRTITAHFDGRAIIPDEPVELPLGRQLRVSVEIAETPSMLESNPPPETLATDEMMRLLDEVAFEGTAPALPDDFSRADIYADHD